MRKLINRFIPFVLIGIAFVAFVFGIMLLSYLFLIGAIVGFILFMIHWIREKFFTSKKSPSRQKGRTIDSDEWRKL